MGAGRKSRPVFTGRGAYGFDRKPEPLYLVTPVPDGPFDDRRGGRPYHPLQNCVVTGGKRQFRCLDCASHWDTRKAAIAHSALQGHFVTCVHQQVIGPWDRDDDVAMIEDHNGVQLADHFPGDHCEEHGACFD